MPFLRSEFRRSMYRVFALADVILFPVRQSVCHGGADGLFDLD